MQQNSKKKIQKIVICLPPKYSAGYAPDRSVNKVTITYRKNIWSQKKRYKLLYFSCKISHNLFAAKAHLVFHQRNLLHCRKITQQE